MPKCDYYIMSVEIITVGSFLGNSLLWLYILKSCHEIY
jgi:hypothetical protein